MTRKVTIIDISRRIAPILGSRDVIVRLKELILRAKAKRIDLNFLRVQFVSRSAVHELIKLKEESFYKKKKDVRFINTNDDVAQMLRAVSFSRVVHKKETKGLEIKSVNIASFIS